MSTMERWTALATILLLAGCSSSPPNPAPGADGRPREAGLGSMNPDAHDPTTEPPIVHTYAPSYTAVWNEILRPTCGTLFCHGGTGLFLNLQTKDVGYASLVGAPATGPECAPLGLERVKPGHPDQSLLYRKVTDAPCGKRMPILYNYSGQLPDQELAQIKRWIELGAPYDALPDASTEAEAGPTIDASGEEHDALRPVISRDGSPDVAGD